jgi:hypothetical protein
MYLASNFVVIHVLSRYGLRTCHIIGSLLLFCGAWLRLIVYATGRFEYIFPGTIVAAFGQGFFINSSSKLASSWFGDKERALSTALGGLSMPIGCIIGFIIAAAMISDEDARPEPEMKTKFSYFLIVQNCVVTFGTVPLMIFAKNKPISPPSKAANRKDEELDFKKELKTLLKNRSYILQCVCFMSIDSICTAMGAIVASLTQPYDYTPIANALCGGIFIISGVIGSFLISIYLDRSPRFKLSIIVTSTFAILSTGLSIITLPMGLLPFALTVALMGLSTIPLTPISFAFAVELTYPTPEAMSNGMMSLPNKLYGAIMGVIASTLC